LSKERPARRLAITPEDHPIQDRLQFAAVPLRPRDGSPRLEDYEAVGRRLVTTLGGDTPLAFLDLEATGIDVSNDRIVELTVVRVEPSGRIELLDTLVDPGCPIPRESTRIHRIDDADVRGAPTFAEIAPALLRILRGAALGGYNHGWYDLPMLQVELGRAGHEVDLIASPLIDACTIFKRMERRNLGAALRFYCGDDLEGAHTAGADVLATMRVFDGQLERYPKLPRQVAGLDELTRPRRRVVPAPVARTAAEADAGVAADDEAGASA